MNEQVNQIIEHFCGKGTVEEANETCELVENIINDAIMKERIKCTGIVESHGGRGNVDLDNVLNEIIRQIRSRET